LSRYTQLTAIADCGDEATSRRIRVPRYVVDLSAAGEAAANGQWDEALPRYRAAAAVSPDPGAIWRRLVSQLCKADRRDMLRTICSEAATVCPGDLWLSLQLAKTCFDEGCVADALAELDRAAGMAPTADRPWIARGDFLLATGCRDEAVAAYRQAIAIRPPGHYLAHAGLGEALIDAHQRTAGDESFRTALALGPASGRPGVMRRWAEAIRRNSNQGNGV
jgi:tetratricopeptide (TPR) repeat protein